jgi:hypothetical protein
MLPLAVFVGALLYTRDLFYSLFALGALPAAILMSLATLGGRSRTTAVCWTAGGLIAVVAAAVVSSVCTGSAQEAHKPKSIVKTKIAVVNLIILFINVVCLSFFNHYT